MKKTLFVCVAALSLMVSGCASTGPVGGSIYADVRGPISATSRPTGSATGEACATSYLGMFAFGDASIEAAAKAGGVKIISHVDHHSTNLLGLITKFCTEVRGHSKRRK